VDLNAREYARIGTYEKLGDSVSADGGLTGDKHKSPGETLPRLIGESLKNADYSAIGCKDPYSDHRYGSKRHHENNQ